MQITIDLTEQQIDQLREVMDGLPIRPYGSLICKVLPALPFFPSSAPPSNKVVVLRRGEQVLGAIEHVFDRMLPHGSSL